MKILKDYSKVVTLFFSILILIQGCTVYKPTTMEQAVKNESKVKVRTKNGEKYKFSRIGNEDGNYYGVSKNKGETVKISLDEKSINTISEKDRTMSTILTVAIPVAVLVLLVSSTFEILGGIGGRGR